MRARIAWLMAQGIDPMTAQDRAIAEIQEKVRIAQTIDDLKQILLYILET